MNKSYHVFIFLAIQFVLSGCSKDFLDKKPASSIVVPKSINDLQALLENHYVMNNTVGLAQVSCDDYVIPKVSDYLAIPDQVSRNAYVWNKDLYQGQTGIRDWNDLYKAVFYANNVLRELDLNQYSDVTARDRLKGWALFSRAYAFYSLVNNFSVVYNAQSADSDSGIPIRLDPGVDYVVGRGTVKDTYARILSDLEKAIPLLNPLVDITHPNRPTKPAVYALQARIYLYMGAYELAEEAATNCLNGNSKLIDFNTLDKAGAIPIGYVNDETLFYSSGVATYDALTYILSGPRPYTIAPEIISSYAVSDLRLQIFFRKNDDNTYTNKVRYSAALTPFTGLTTAELCLIKAECLARRGETADAMDMLNRLLVKRWNPNATVPASPYVNMVAVDARDALNKILIERRKELVWRGLRWSDLKRLNREGRAISLTRVLNGVTYSLEPNSAKYTFPIPDDEIEMSEIIQNQR
jgi:tetratricopeptide (TPR) repeat protein